MRTLMIRSRVVSPRQVSLLLVVLASQGCGESTPAGPELVAAVLVTAPASTVASGGTMQLVAVARSRAGATLADRSISWTSSDASLATVAAGGLLTAGQVLVGSPQPVTLTASSEGISGATTLSVLPVPVAAVRITPDSALLRAGASVALAAAVTSAAGTPLVGRAIVWQSTDPGVATASAAGVVVAVSHAGGDVRRALIIASSEGRADTAAISVTPVPAAVVQVTPSTIALVESDSAPVSITVRDSAGTILTGRTVTWSTSDTTVARVVAGVRVVATPYVGEVLSRTASVRATVEGVTGTATVTSTVDLGRSSTFYQEVVNGFPSLSSYYVAIGGGVAPGMTVVDVNRDGRDDLILHLFRYGGTILGSPPDTPVRNRLVALVANSNGTFRDATQELFGATVVDVAGAATIFPRIADLNEDGYPDWVYPTTREDGRPYVNNFGAWDAPAAAVLSNGNGTYRVVTFGAMRARYAVELTRAAGQPWRVVYRNEMYEYTASGFTPVPYDLPPLGVSAIRAFSSTVGGPTDRLLGGSAPPFGIPVGLRLFTRTGSTWQPTAAFDFSTFRRIHWDDGIQVVPNTLVSYQGFEIVPGDFNQSCVLRLTPGGPQTLVAQYAGFSVVGGSDGRTVIHVNHTTFWNRLFDFTVVGDQLQAGSLFNGTDGPYSVNRIDCTDVNGDGYQDVTTHPVNYFARPRVFLNNRAGALGLLPDARFPAGPFRIGWSSIFLDFDGDGIKDLAQIPENGCGGAANCAVFRLFRARRPLR